MTTTTVMDTYEPSTLAELTEWLAEQCRAGADKLYLRRRSEDVMNNELVRTWPIEGAVVVAELANKILQTAHDDGRFLGNSVYGVFSTAKRAPLGRYFLRVDGEMGEQPTYAVQARGEPNLAGVLAAHMSQMMRHQESQSRLQTGHTLDVIGHYKALLDARERRIAELERMHANVVLLQERLLSMQHQRDSENKRVDIESKKAEFATGVFKDGVDMAMKYLREKGDEKMGLERFLGSLTEEQMTPLLSVLRPEQVKFVVETYDKYAKKNGAKEPAQPDKPTEKEGGHHEAAE